MITRLTVYARTLRTDRGGGVLMEWAMLAAAGSFTATQAAALMGNQLQVVFARINDALLAVAN